MTRKLFPFLTGIFLYFSAFTQKTDSIRRQTFMVPQEELQLLMNYYTQNGKHSAVTGGIGSERLTVYAPQAMWSKQKINGNKLHLKAGIDVISSASTDKIDYVVSSASRVDRRFNIEGGHEKFVSQSGIRAGFNAGLSLESDYTAFSPSVHVIIPEADDMSYLSLQAAFSFDDLRWGRVNPGHLKPVMLIYPWELRDTSWDKNFKRNSYSLVTNLYQVTSRRNILELGLLLTLQQGLLSTPFHRVYFTNAAVRVEHLPALRYKAGLIINDHYAVNKKIYLHGGLQAYLDNWGIKAISFLAGPQIKLNKQCGLQLNARYYMQLQTKYFKRYGQHKIDAEFYTSDHDLATFQDITLGIGVDFIPGFHIYKWNFDRLHLELSGYQRSDELKAIIFSLTVNFGKEIWNYE